MFLHFIVSSQKTENRPDISKPRKDFTEVEIQQLIVSEGLYDESTDILVTDCHGKTPLHYAIIAKHENVITCFQEFNGKYWLQETLPSPFTSQILSNLLGKNKFFRNLYIWQHR